jgi:hypothetical protein
MIFILLVLIPLLWMECRVIEAHVILGPNL